MRARVGIFRVGSLGDHLIALPLYHRLRELHVEDELLLFTNVQESGNLKKVGPAALLPPELFDAIHDYPAVSGWRAIRQKLRLFRATRIERLYYLMPPRSSQQLWRDRLFFGLAGVRVIGMQGRDALTPRFLPGSGLYEHEMDRLARAMSEVDTVFPKTPRYRSLRLSPAERSEARQLLKGEARCAVALSIGTKCDVNDWGLDNWAELVGRLADLRGPDQLIVLGSADEFAPSETLRARWSGRFENFCGRLSVRQSAAVLSEARLFIGHDSGPMHLAAAVDIPVVGIFSARNPPGVWFPLTEKSHIHYSHIECMGCGRMRCEDRQKECIRRITVEQVYDSCLAHVAEESARLPAAMNS